jgi:two-component system, NarL family, nitrate/nitrite response regulator NarL
MEHAVDTAQPKPIRVFLICRVRLYCAAITALLSGEPSIVLAGTASPSEDIVAALDAAVADVVLLDAGSANTLQLAQNLLRERPDARVLGFAVDDAPAEVIACAQAGLCGYVPSSASMRELVTAVRRIAGGDIVCSPSIADGIFRHMRSASLRASPDVPERVLTRRQQQIVRLIGEGLSNKEIARRLALGDSTVKNHVHDILERLQVSRRGEAAARLRRNPYIP